MRFPRRACIIKSQDDRVCIRFAPIKWFDWSTTTTTTEKELKKSASLSISARIAAGNSRERSNPAVPLREFIFLMIFQTDLLLSVVVAPATVAVAAPVPKREDPRDECSVEYGTRTPRRLGITVCFGVSVNKDCRSRSAEALMLRTLFLSGNGCPISRLLITLPVSLSPLLWRSSFCCIFCKFSADDPQISGFAALRLEYDHGSVPNDT